MSWQQKAEQVLSHFQNHWRRGRPTLMVRSPGRINMIGEHTDYNEGFVLPAAIDRAIIFGLAPREDGQARLAALDLQEEVNVSLHQLQPHARNWANYLLGVVDQLQQQGHQIPGFDCAFGGDIPVASGLSSSAALESGLIFALNHLFQLKLPLLKMARLAQQAENQFVGVQCGIMDQYSNLYGRQGHLLKLDCRFLQHEYFPFPQDRYQILLCDTHIRRELANSEYNLRRQQCQQGVVALQAFAPDIRSLRDVPLEFLEAHRADLDEVIYKRCHFVVQENQRVLDACQDILQNNWSRFGQRMYASHQGLRDEFEVSCPELDFLVETAASLSGVLGARLMGAGFGGCTIQLVEAEQAAHAGRLLQEAYQKKFRRSISLYYTQPEDGTAVLEM